MPPRPIDETRPASFINRKKALLCLCAIGALTAVNPLRSAPSLATDRTAYATGEPISVTFAGGPANAADWIGIYAQGVTPSGNPRSVSWLYTNGTQTAGGGRSGGALVFPAGLEPGNYAAWFLSNNGYSVLAGPAPFSVAGAPPAWRVNAIRLRHAVVGDPYTARIRAFATAPETRRFQKVDGPDWLQVNPDGDISGIPGAGNVGTNTFTLRLENAATAGSSEVPLTIEVFAAGREHVSEITVMSFNTWKGWTGVSDGFEKAVTAIVQANADLIGLQESSEAAAQKMADELGWFRVASGTGSAQIISRYPVVSTHPVSGIESDRIVGATIRLATNPPREVVFFNTHLDYLYYGPYAAYLTGATESSVLTENNRSARVPQITAVLAGMANSIANADITPVFLTGDFNVPSHLDWTAATASKHGGVGSVAWPESTRVQAAGLIDSFRRLHPDPVEKPGESWSTIHKGTEPQDRIDFVYYRGKALRPLASDLYATEVQTTVGPWTTNRNPSSVVAANSWPSDHFAAKTTFEIESAAPPTPEPTVTPTPTPEPTPTPTPAPTATPKPTPNSPTQFSRKVQVRRIGKRKVTVTGTLRDLDGIRKVMAMVNGKKVPVRFDNRTWKIHFIVGKSSAKITVVAIDERGFQELKRYRLG